MQNYYAELNLTPTASEEDIKKAINREARVWHNRTNSPNMQQRQEAERMVMLLDEAEKILLNDSKREEYDRQLKNAPKQEQQMGESEIDGEENLVELGWKLLINGEVADAMYVARKATDKEPGNPKAWELSAQAKFRWGEAEDSIYEYKRSINLVPNEASLYFDLGCVYESVERFIDALKQYEHAAQLDPSITMYRAGIGIVLIKNEEYDKGLDILDSCVNEEPENPTYQLFMAIAYADSAHLGWSYVGNGHPLLEPAYYATTYEHITYAQANLEKATNLKFDDSALMSKLQSIKQDIDSMLKRKFTGSWPTPIMAIIIGMFMLGDILVKAIIGDFDLLINS